MVLNRLIPLPFPYNGIPANISANEIFTTTKIMNGSFAIFNFSSFRSMGIKSGISGS